MKQCPQCKQHFEDAQNFCDSDGSTLLDETALLRAALSGPGASAVAIPLPEKTYGQGQRIWPIVTIGILIGVIICLGAYVMMITTSIDKDGLGNKKTETAKLNTADRSAQAATIKPEALPAPTVEKPAEETATESPSPTPAEAVAATQDASASLNNGPISTNRQDGEKRGRTVIKLKSGVRVEADAAWEDRMGIWYRQGGLVSYVERERIESIGEPPRPKSSPAETDKP